MKTWLAPRQYERRYGRFLRKTAEALRKELLDRLGDVVRLQNRSSANVGAEADTVSIVIEEVVKWWAIKREEDKRNYAGYFALVNNYNDNQFLAVVLSLTGLALPPNRQIGFVPGQTYSNTIDMIDRLGPDADIYRQEPYLESVANNWVQTQDTYVDNAVTQTIKSTELIVRNALITSATSKAIREAINKALDTSSKRLQRGGEEQVSILDAVLTRERQKSIGANEYVWETRRDERVRGNPNGLYPKAKPSHFARDREVFSWNKPPEGGHPGEAYGCRCRAVMRLARK